jgi:hypothetical protein
MLHSLWAGRLGHDYADFVSALRKRSTDNPASSKAFRYGLATTTPIAASVPGAREVAAVLADPEFDAALSCSARGRSGTETIRGPVTTAPPRPATRTIPDGGVPDGLSVGSWSHPFERRTGSSIASIRAARKTPVAREPLTFGWRRESLTDARGRHTGTLAISFFFSSVGLTAVALGSRRLAGKGRGE